jgi:hypothetical protein
VPETEWESQVALLCDSARLIVIVPLFGVQLETDDIKYVHPPSRDIIELLKKKDHDGLKIELKLLSNDDLATKTILCFLVTFPTVRTSRSVRPLQKAALFGRLNIHLRVLVTSGCTVALKELSQCWL